MSTACLLLLLIPTAEAIVQQPQGQRIQEGFLGKGQTLSR